VASDVVIVGGGPAGLSAALLLGRARRSVVLLDAGEGRNAPSEASHSFFTRDGAPPAGLRRIGQEQLRPYETVTARMDSAVGISGKLGQFDVHLAEGETLGARLVILATGVRDVLPEIPGVDRYWGKGVYQCPFCDGWEHRDQPMAVLAPAADMAVEAAALYGNWTADLSVLTNGSWEPNGDVGEHLAAMGASVVTDSIARVEGDVSHLNRVVFSTGRELPVSVLWIRTEQHARSEFARDLSSELYDAGHTNGLITVDARGQTTVPGVFAAGDITSPMHQLSLAVASGTMAAAGAASLLIRESDKFL
jgi:thioredoxin reductase